MSKRLSISDEDMSALYDVAPDPQDWLGHVITAAIAGAISQRRAEPGWMTVAISFAKTGGDPEDDRGVLLHGLTTGQFKDAAQRHADAIAAAMAAITEESQP
ncbi:hypothetical protein [Devosia sp. SL43]|uniref:hypothetical protein n=1 Tax=Devosia sp. SL43 TaxID=2806348 RepID=UPI001F159412|nr:hypothetical protein [Devosia sp. SL43]UJW87949.1 hypothetical protein IM737_20560 [Devosia sp. SL43]